jgi:hypothetical protein
VARPHARCQLTAQPSCQPTSSLWRPPDSGEPQLLPSPLPAALKNVQLVTLDPTPDVVQRLRDKLAADIERNKAILGDYRTDYADAQKRVVALDRLQTLLFNQLNGVVSVDAQAAYKAMYGSSAPTPRTLRTGRS